MAGLLFASLENWSALQTDESKIGFGFSGDLLAGVIWDKMYFGVGPHIGYNFWTLSKSYSGHTASATTSVTDVGFDFGVAWEGFYMTLGGGSGTVGISASFDGESTETINPFDAGIGYTRVGFGWFDGFAFGISFVSYSQATIPNNLSRTEFNFGWAF